MNIKDMTDEQILQEQVDLENRQHQLHLEIIKRYESRYGKSLVRTVASETQKLLDSPSMMQRSFIGLFPNPGNDVPRQGEITAMLIHRPGLEDEWELISVYPKCPTNGLHSYQCSSCWFEEFITQVGLEEVVKDIKWDDKGRYPCAIEVNGAMESEYLGNGDYDDKFILGSFHVVPSTKPMCKAAAPGSIASTVPPTSDGRLITPWCHLEEGHSGPHKCGPYIWND